MKRKSTVKKIARTTKKKGVKIKFVGTASKSPQKTAVKKKQTKKVAFKIKGKKTQAKKRKSEVQIKVKEDKKPKKTERKTKMVAKETVSKKAVPKRTIKKTPAKAPLKTLKKAEVPPKAEKPSKTIKVKTTAKRDRKEKAKKIKKTTKKISEKPQKKITAGKPVRETLPRKKLTPQKLREVTQIKKAEVLKEAKDVKVVPELKEIKADTIPTGYPPAEVPFPPVPLETLPSEYGENGIILMTVNPYKLFAFWEVRKETLNVFKGKLTLRVYDVTDIDFDSMKANSFLDIAVRERVGKAYVNVSHSKEYIADIGIIYNGIFITIARSPKVSTPGAGIPTAEEFLQEIFDDGIRIGY